MTKILVVEDEPLLLMLAVDVVEEAGFDAVEATNADDAIALLETVGGITVVWTDIDMPGSMNGLMLVAEVHDRWPPVKFIVVSGMQIPNWEELPEGGVFYAKPYDAREVTETLVRLSA